MIPLVVLLFALQIFTQLLINYQWCRVASLTDTKISFWDMMYINCQGGLVDSITPKLGGEVTRAFKLSKIKKHGTTLVVLQKFFSLSAMFLVLAFTELVFALILLAFLGVFFVLSKNQKYAKKAPRFLRDFLHTLLGQMDNIRKQKKASSALFLLSLFIWVLYPVKMYLLVLHFYSDISFFQVAIITFTAYMVAQLPIFPGGLGGFEATMSAMLAVQGIPLGEAITITVIFRFVTFWFVALFSLLYIFIARRKSH